MGHDMDYMDNKKNIRYSLYNMGFGEKSTCCGAQYGLWIKRALAMGHNMGRGYKKGTCCGVQYGPWIKRALATGHNMGCG